MDGETRYCIAGYATIYQYYAYPANTRPRISQVLILPPFQRKGLGSKLLNTVYRHYLTDDKVVDITGKEAIKIQQKLNEPSSSSGLYQNSGLDPYSEIESKWKAVI